MTVAQQTLALEGVHCASCVLRIEKHLAALAGVRYARGNATQRRLRLEWDEGQQSIDGLAQEIATLGYQARPISNTSSDTSEPSLLPRLAVAALGTMNIMAFSVSVWFGLVTDMEPGTIQFMHWMSAAIALPVMLYSGSVFHGPALKGLRAGNLTMDAPITIAIWMAFAGSVFETLQGSHDVYFDAVVSLVFLLLIGRVLEQAMRRRSDHASENLRETLNGTAHRIDPQGQPVTVDASALREGDQILVYTGDILPADGVLLSGAIDLDESFLTGEAKPRCALTGDTVIAGAVLLGGPATLRVTHVGDASQMGQMAQMIDDVAAHKGQLQLLSDRFARSYIPLVSGGSFAGFILWYAVIGAGAAQSLQIAIAVLIVTCPCAAGLATPAVTARAANIALKMGVIVKSGEALETLGAVDHILIDKTGTASQPGLKPDDGIDPAVLHAAKSLAAGSRHPLARAVLDGAQVKAIEGVRECPGEGVVGPDGARLGSASFVGVPMGVDEQSSLYYRTPDGVLHALPLQERARPDLGKFLADARRQSIGVTLHSGDTTDAVKRFAMAHGFESCNGAQSPLEKLEAVEAVQSLGKTTLMLGDGINDSVALSGADVSVSFAGATDIAQCAADVVMTRPDVTMVTELIRFSRAARSLIAQNLAFATFYNVVTVPLALAGFLTPAIAALLMSSSSIIVLANGFRLRWQG